MVTKLTLVMVFFVGMILNVMTHCVAVTFRRHYQQSAGFSDIARINWVGPRALRSRKGPYYGASRIFGAEGGTRTRTGYAHHPLKMTCLPIPPLRQIFSYNRPTAPVRHPQQPRLPARHYPQLAGRNPVLEPSVLLQPGSSDQGRRRLRFSGWPAWPSQSWS